MMITALGFGSSGPFSNPGRGTAVGSWTSQFYTHAINQDVDPEVLRSQCPSL